MLESIQYNTFDQISDIVDFLNINSEVRLDIIVQFTEPH